MYLKRSKTPTTWPITRKGTKYIVAPSHNLKSGVPLMIMLREFLKIGETRREVRKSVVSGQIMVNGKEIKNGKYGLSLNDTISLKSGEHYRLTYSDTRKFILEKISAAESMEKVSKIVGKKLLRGNVVQVSLLDGRTFITKSDVKIGNSALIDLKKNDLKKEVPLHKGSEVLVIAGKHIGKRGKVEEVSEDGIGRVAFSGGKKIGLQLNNLMAMK